MLLLVCMHCTITVIIIPVIVKQLGPIRKLHYSVRCGELDVVVDIFRAHGNTMARRRRESVL